MMFMYRMDYDLFQTYELTSLPEREKKIHRYSNLAVLEVIRKIGYAFLLCSYLYRTDASMEVEIYAILGFVLCFQIIWYIAMPFDPKT
jgi:hypothetical protein